MKKGKRKLRGKLPTLSRIAKERIKDALSNLESADGSTLSEIQVYSDELADALRKAYFDERKDPFPGFTASLTDVLDELDSHYDIGESALICAYTLQESVEDSYREDLDEDLESDVAHTVQELTSAVRTLAGIES